MCDYREEFYNKVIGQIATTVALDNDKLETIKNILSANLYDYEITDRCTDLVAQDDEEKTSEQINLAAMQRFTEFMTVENRSKKTIKIYIRTAMRFLESVNRCVLHVTTMDVLGWLAQMQLGKNKTSAATCENYRSYLAAFFKFLKQKKMITENPMEGINRIFIPKVNKASFSDVEIDSIRLACKNKRERVIVEFLLSSGVRIEELVNVKVSDVDFSDNSVVVRSGKGRKMRTTYISNVCAKHLKDYLRTRKIADVHVIGHGRSDATCETVLPSSVRKTLNIIAKRAGVSNVHPHRFRRTFATICYKRGMDINKIRRLMGHSDIQTTTLYIDELCDDLKYAYGKCS